MLKRPVTNKGSILLGELLAIRMALEFAQSEQRKRPFSWNNHIFRQSVSSLNSTLGWTQMLIIYLTP